MGSLTERLLDRRIFVGDCWLYDGARDKDGYGRISVAGINTPAHRAAWIAFRGDPGNLQVLHNQGCESRACFNPSHLHLGTVGQNMAERAEWGHGHRGEQTPNSILTEEKVREAGLLRSQGATWRHLGNVYGVAESTIRHAVTGLSWGHLQKAGQ